MKISDLLLIIFGIISGMEIYGCGEKGYLDNVIVIIKKSNTDFKIIKYQSQKALKNNGLFYNYKWHNFIFLYTIVRLKLFKPQIHRLNS